MRASRIWRNMPERTHCWNRRWHVWYGGKRSGRSHQRAPDRSIHKIPLRISRSLRRGQPRPSSRNLCFGIRGSKRTHCSSDNSSRRAIVWKIYMTLWQSTSHFYIFEIGSSNLLLTWQSIRVHDDQSIVNPCHSNRISRTTYYQTSQSSQSHFHDGDYYPQ